MNAIMNAIINEMNEMTAIVILSILLLVVWTVLLRNSSKTKDTITTLTNKINVLENIMLNRITLFEEQNKKINDMDEIIFTLMEQNKLLIKSHDEIIKDTNDSQAITTQEFNEIKYKINNIENTVDQLDATNNEQNKKINNIENTVNKLDETCNEKNKLLSDKTQTGINLYNSMECKFIKIIDTIENPTKYELNNLVLQISNYFENFQPIIEYYRSRTQTSEIQLYYESIPQYNFPLAFSRDIYNILVKYFNKYYNKNEGGHGVGHFAPLRQFQYISDEDIKKENSRLRGDNLDDKLDKRYKNPCYNTNSPRIPESMSMYGYWVNKLSFDTDEEYEIKLLKIVLDLLKRTDDWYTHHKKYKKIKRGNPPFFILCFISYSILTHSFQIYTQIKHLVLLNVRFHH